MPKVIIISQVPLPFPYIASWTSTFNYYLQKSNHEIDFIICPQPHVELIKGIEYSLVKDSTFLAKLKSKLRKRCRWNNYFKALDKIVKPNEKYVIQIIDNSGFVVPLDAYIKLKYKKENFYIQYYYHGFYPLFTNPSEKSFFNGINEMIFLTKLSYKAYLNYYIEFPCKATVLNNAIDSKQFFKLDNSAKEIQKQLMGFKSKIIFIWCSQDRPKKGLDFILQVWKKIFEKYGGEVELLIVGANRENEYPGVNFIGRVPNDELAKYYQIADFYLFPTFWKEGFGIVLSEALKSGCYCIASNQGGVPEVLQFGKIGRIVENPNFIKEWVLAIEEGIEIYKQNDYNNPYSTFIDDDLYDIDNWCNEMNSIIQESKYNLIN